MSLRRLLRVIVLAAGLICPLSHSGEVTYEYDESGRLRAVTYPDTTQRKYTLDAAGNRTQLQTTLGGGALQFSVPNPGAIPESAGSFSITVTRTRSTNGTVAVRYATAAGSATPGSDFTASSGTLNWAAGDSTPRTVTVPILDDSVFEGAETFTLALSDPENGAILGDGSQVTLTIADNDVVSFSIFNMGIGEANGTAVVTVTKTGATALAHTVNYATANGSATAGTDYTAVSGTLSFAPEEITKTFSVPIANQTVFEGNETFTVNLSAPTGGAILSQASGTVTIVDSVVPRFGINGVLLAENGGSMTFVVAKAESTLLTHAVSYTTANVTASAGSDYSPVGGTLTFLPSTTALTITVPILTDSVFEGIETFSITLTSVTNGASITTPVGIGTITDSNTPPHFLLQGGGSYLEGSGRVAPFTVTKSGSTALTHSINFGVTAGSASAGSDFTPGSGTLTFAPGETVKSIEVTVLDDAVFEGNEFASIALSNPTGGATFGNAPWSFEILDNEAPNVITLRSEEITVHEVSGTSASGFVNIRTDGDLHTSNGNRGAWLSPKTNMHLYQVRASYGGGCHGITGAALNTWLPLTGPGSPVWAPFISGFNTNASCTVSLEISLISNPSVILGIAHYTFNLLTGT